MRTLWEEAVGERERERNERESRERGRERERERGQHKRARFEDDVLSLGVLGHIRSETNCRRALARRVDAARRYLVHVLQQLRF